MNLVKVCIQTMIITKRKDNIFKWQDMMTIYSKNAFAVDSEYIKHTNFFERRSVI